MSKEPGASFSGIRACRNIVNFVVRVELLACPATFTIETTYSIDPSSKNIENALSDKPRQSHLTLHLRNAECLDAMENRKEGAQAHSNEHESAERSPRWRAEPWE